MFAEGQAYVALSRVRSLDGLQLIGSASPSCIKVSDVVRRFYATIARKEKARRRLLCLISSSHSLPPAVR